MDRRNFLKFFTAGSIVTPFIGGAEAAVARLIEVPKIEIVEPPKVIGVAAFNMQTIASASVTLKLYDGTHLTREHVNFAESWRAHRIPNVDQAFIRPTIEHFGQLDRVANTRLCQDCYKKVFLGEI